ncbi:MAG: CRTAC1 family protein [Planctomycetales bacterium]|nr:CRTAC1 family protein [Planctomycetales bacterium]
MTHVSRLLTLGLLIASVGCHNSSRPEDGASREADPPASSIGSSIGRLGDPVHSTEPLTVVPLLTDIADSVGIEFDFFADIVPERYFLPEIMGGGVGWIDYDLDGRLDLYAANGAELIPSSDSTIRPLDALFRQSADRFIEVAGLAGIEEPGYGQGIAVGDYDADGFPDLFVANYGRNRLFHNQGDGSFIEVGDSVGITGETWSSSPLWLDVDGDLNLDLVVVNYMDVRADNYKACPYGGIVGYCGPGDYRGIDDQVWLNNGAGRFTEQARSLGLVGNDGKGLASVAVDLDNDLKPEIYIANDMVNNFLFTQSRTEASDPNVSSTPFSDVALLSGVAAGETGQPEASMGIALGDLDRDGQQDLLLTHYHTHKNTLYRNRGQLMFSDDSKRSGIARISLPFLGFGTVAMDFDRDMDLDLFVANGHVLGPHHNPERMTPQMLTNDGQMKFQDISGQAGDYFRGQYLARSVASADWDSDGDLDLAVSRIGDPLSLLDNQTDTDRHWIGLELFDPARRDLVGGRIEVMVGSERQVVAISTGGSYLAAPDKRLLVGLGSFDNAVASGDDEVLIVIHWNDGLVERWPLPNVDRYWRLEPGRAPVDLESLPN